jgi:hypothetical protein
MREKNGRETVALAPEAPLTFCDVLAVKARRLQSRGWRAYTAKHRSACILPLALYSTSSRLVQRDGDGTQRALPVIVKHSFLIIPGRFRQDRH